MKLKKFRIKNYKSIIDSGDCYFSDTVTVLAGKNESGKTSILEALEDFDTERPIRPESKPIKTPDAITEISISFEIDKKDLSEIIKSVGSGKVPSEPFLLEVKKTSPNIYTIPDDAIQSLGLAVEKDDTKLKEDIVVSWKKIKQIYDKYPQIGGTLTDPELENIQDAKNILTQFKGEATPNLAVIVEEPERQEFVVCLDTIIAQIGELEKIVSPAEKFIEEIKDWIPYFILFSSFNDVFPNKIPFADLENNEWIKDLSVISDLKIDTIKTSSDRDREKHRDDVNVKLNEDYKKFWTQDISNLSINWDTQHLYFWIKEDGTPYEPSLRSKGRQWHLAFYIKVSARAKEDVQNVILIDEPGLFLHAQAQKDILEKLEDSAKDTQIVFSTHSPYLLEADKLDRIRLIYRTKKKGTVIENKIHALADKETLTPILTAIGLELNAGIAGIDKNNNVIVEGASDIYYLEAFKKINNVGNINFVFGGGAGNMPFVGTILHGWGCNLIYLYDNDQGKKDAEKNLKKNWLVVKELITSVLEKEGRIEDIFDPIDFKKYVLKDEAKQFDEINSEYAKKNKIDKVLSAKLFLESVRKAEVTLSETTTQNIIKLIDKIKNNFSESN